MGGHWSPAIGGISCPQGTLGNVWGHFWLSQLGCVWWVQVRDVASHPTVRRTALPSRGSSGPGCPCCRGGKRLSVNCSHGYDLTPLKRHFSSFLDTHAGTAKLASTKLQVQSFDSEASFLTSRLIMEVGTGGVVKGGGERRGGRRTQAEKGGPHP